MCEFVSIYFGDTWHNRVTQYLSKWLWGYNNIDSLLLQMINTTLSYARQAALCTDHSSTFTRSHLWLETLIYRVIFHSFSHILFYLLYQGFYYPRSWKWFDLFLIFFPIVVNTCKTFYLWDASNLSDWKNIDVNSFSYCEIQMIST